MLKEIYDKGRQLSEKMAGFGAWLASKTGGPEKNGKFAGFTAAMVFGGSLLLTGALGATLTPAFGLALLATGKMTLIGGGALGLLTSTYVGMAAFGKGAMDRGEEHCGIFATGRQLFRDVLKQIRADLKNAKGQKPAQDFPVRGGAPGGTSSFDASKAASADFSGATKGAAKGNEKPAVKKAAVPESAARRKP
ncbi:MAG: hypothetical protein GC185_08985 [Alphaproteobacteria bacterium]|nr:hypothetical protein [Alphaproteobacteria bacterium]